MTESVELRPWTAQRKSERLPSQQRNKFKQTDKLSSRVELDYPVTLYIDTPISQIISLGEPGQCRELERHLGRMYVEKIARTTTVDNIKKAFDIVRLAEQQRFIAREGLDRALRPRLVLKTKSAR